MCLVFFFSSRRRHTRYWRDWSSDVCSSDLGGQRWVQLKGGMPVAQARDMTIQKRENDLVVATFGRGFYVLDDYSPLRELATLFETSALNDAARLLPLRDAYLYNQTGLAPAGTAGIGPMSGNWT